MGQRNLFIFIAVLLAGYAEMMPSQPGSMQTVKITPLGSHDGEFRASARSTRSSSATSMAITSAT